MVRYMLLVLIFIPLSLAGCPGNDNQYEVEEEDVVYEWEQYEDVDTNPEQPKREKVDTHLENPADIAGDLIF